MRRRVWRGGGGIAAERRPFEVRSQEVEVRSHDIEVRSHEIQLRRNVEVRSHEIRVRLCSREAKVVKWIALWRSGRSDSFWM